MNIIFSSDDNYSPYLAISIFSILKKNENKSICFYVLDLGISEKNKVSICEIVKLYNCKIIFESVNKYDFSNFPRTIEYISLATYARLNLTKYIKDIDKAIYIDVDTITNGSLDELWETNIEDYYMAACQDTFIDIEKSDYKDVINLREYTYFNAGVLLINLKKWQEIDVFNRSIDWLENYRTIIKYQDQDILNGIFSGKVKFLNNRFNFTPSERHLIKNGYKSKTRMPVVIYHYCGAAKFWHKNCDHTNSQLSYKLLNELSNKIILPENWMEKFDGISLIGKINKEKRRIKDKVKYKIY